MAQIVIHDSTINRIESITGKKMLHGGDKMINMAFDILQQQQENLKN